jgi:ER lumen protein retaining receptor
MEPVLAMFTLGYAAQLLGNYLLIRKIRKTKHTEGLSFDTQVCYLVGTIARIIWNFETKLSRHYLVWIELLLSISSTTYIVHLFRKYKTNNIMEIKNPFKFVLLLLGSAILSVCFHPGGKGDYFFTMQMLVSFTMFLEACGLLPQIYYLRKVEYIEKTTGQYVFTLAISRIFRLVFWWLMWRDGAVFGQLMIADVLHTALLGDFVYYFIKARDYEHFFLK